MTYISDFSVMGFKCPEKFEFIEKGFFFIKKRKWESYLISNGRNRWFSVDSFMLQNF